MNDLPSKPLEPIWPDYCEAARAAVAVSRPPSTKHRSTSGWREYRMLLEAVWPDMPKDATFEQVLERARAGCLAVEYAILNASLQK